MAWVGPAARSKGRGLIAVCLEILGRPGGKQGQRRDGNIPRVSAKGTQQARKAVLLYTQLHVLLERAGQLGCAARAVLYTVLARLDFPMRSVTGTELGRVE